MNDVDLFISKNKYLKELYEEVNYKDFYRDIFPEGSFERKMKYSDRKGNGIAVVIEDESYRRTTITDDLKEIDKLIENQFVISNGISYFGKERTLRNATLMYAMIFDIDGLSDLNKIVNLNSHIVNDISPKPTYLVNSGHGVHLYYVFEEPIPLYNHLKEPLRRLKYVLTSRLWNMYVSDIKEIQYQGLNQGFRMVGSPTKLGFDYKLSAFKTGEKISLDYLNKYVSDDKDKIKTTDYVSTMTLEESKLAYPDWYHRKITNKEDSKTWVIKRDLYDWWIRKIKDGATYGHRYFCIMALSIYAIKCNIPYDELEKDAIELIPFLNKLNPEEPFSLNDVLSALNSYDESYKNFPREDIAKITAIDIPENKRNGRTQEQHLQIARATRDIVNPDWRGNKSKEVIVRDYIEKHPNKTPTEISRELQVSRPTVYKYMKK